MGYNYRALQCTQIAQLSAGLVSCQIALVEAEAGVFREVAGDQESMDEREEDNDGQWGFNGG